MVNSGKSLLLKDLSYKAMAGNYKCTVIGIGGQNSGNSVLEVYCKYTYCYCVDQHAETIFQFNRR